MPRSPWFAAVQPDPSREYVALLTYLPLRRYAALPRFFWLSTKIQSQLKNSQGLIGYSLEAKIFGLQFWTLSAWTEQDSLNEFVGKVPHSDAMRALAPHMGKPAFSYWTARGSELPLDWAEAKRRLNQR
jgi:hypothetical protein